MLRHFRVGTLARHVALAACAARGMVILPATQRAIVVTAHGGPEVLSAASDWPVPEPSEHEVVVKNVVAGVNFIDTYFRTGSYPSSPPYVAGLEGAGRIVALGTAAGGRLQLGQRVAYPRCRSGSYAEYTAVSADSIVPLPTDVDFKVGAATMIQGLTAHYLCRDAYAAGNTTRALVHAAAGGTGQAVVQVLKHLGARVVATVGDAQKEAIARSAGADDVILYRRGGEQIAWVEPVRAAAGGRLDVVYDGVGKSTLLQSLDAVGTRGTVVLFGAASGQPDPVPISALKGSKYLIRPTLFDYVADAAELHARADEVFAWLRAGVLRPTVHESLALEDAAEAHRRLEGRRTTGKLLLALGEPGAEGRLDGAEL